MKQKDYSKLTNEELLLEKKTAKINLTVITISIGVMVLTTIYKIFNKKIDVFTFFPLIFAPILFSSLKKYKSINSEINSRNLK